MQAGHRENEHFMSFFERKALSRYLLDVGPICLNKKCVSEKRKPE